MAARLGADLSPVDAERAGNADGSIPAYTGGMKRTAPIDPKVGGWRVAQRFRLPQPIWLWRIPSYAIGALASSWLVQRVASF